MIEISNDHYYFFPIVNNLLLHNMLNLLHNYLLFGYIYTFIVARVLGIYAVEQQAVLPSEI